MSRLISAGLVGTVEAAIGVLQASADPDLSGPEVSAKLRGHA
jgi:hypothetical protein